MRVPTTVDQTRAPVPVRIFNRAGAALEKISKPRALSAAKLIETAKRRSALDDFGGDEFVEPLSRLLESCHREARLNSIGKIALRADVIRILCNRLAIERDRALYPEIAQQQIRAPLFIVGLPRSGTTLLHTLLAADPANRAPLTWEVMSPSPPTLESRSKRIREASRGLAMLRWLAPTFEAVHATGAELPQECVSLMSPTFMSDQFDTMYNVPAYRSWFLNRNMQPAYKFHCRFLQHLQYRRAGERWVLKAPAHMFAAETLLTTYPDAQFVQVHREPIDAVASVSSLVTILRRVFSDDVDPIQIGKDAGSYWSEAIGNFLRARDSISPSRVYDIKYDSLRRDPIAAIERIYQHFGWPLSEDAQKRMRAVLAEQSPEHNGTHRYDAAQFNLNDMSGFAEYCERFGLARDEIRERREIAA